MPTSNPYASGGDFRADAFGERHAEARAPEQRAQRFTGFDELNAPSAPPAGAIASSRQQPNGWQRWKMVSLDPRDKLPPAPAFVPSEPAPPPIDFAAIEAMREGARKEGYAQGYTQGQTQGYGDGHREGYARGLETARSEAARLHDLAATFSTALRRVDEEVAQSLIALALDVARQLVRQTVAAEPAVLLPAVRELLAAEPALAGSPCLLVHPDDVTLLHTHLQGELEAAGWVVRGDAAIARGGCIASAASGEIDATLTTRWNRVVKAMGRDEPWEPPHD
ncbi:flagellar assembly protein FliH [Cupriavidus respiraculi]|uniref:flagellar assembly protein FliH n=1 Tax=Cupriavidus respiraculi TaxID=195930 RepID=UPI001C989DC7|nr:flagellar assembly protein FliH [Cupriavidus respiraculi]MBY4947377.1 flagellar assembly protein FliH [Cupriavidus respiraculi]